jgi:hypothetical protein
VALCFSNAVACLAGSIRMTYASASDSGADGQLVRFPITNLSSFTRLRITIVFEYLQVLEVLV